MIRISDARSSVTDYCIEIQNTGSFIDAERRQKIFDLGFTSGKEHGSGLGLAYAAEVMRQSGGSISCESDADLGTSFILTFPRLVLSSGLKTESVTRIAVIDDDLFVGLAWQRQCAGLKVDHYQSAESFISVIEQANYLDQRYQIVIIDFNFDQSKYNGLDIARVLKRIDNRVTTVLSTSQQMTWTEIGDDGLVDLVIGKKATTVVELQTLVHSLRGPRLRA